MFKFFYSTILWCAGFLAIPIFLYKMIFRKKYKDSFFQKWGYSLPKGLYNGDKPSLWVHAVSLGEAKAIIPLAKLIKKEFPEYSLIFSTITETGQAEVKKNCPEADTVLYLPFDFLMRRIIKRIKPRLILLCETDFWFNFLEESKRQGAKIILVNGKISKKSFRLFSLLPFLSKKLFSLFDLMLVQNGLYQERFSHLGIPSGKIRVTGNIKLDAPDEADDIDAFKKTLGIGDEAVLVAGSTHPTEEAIVIESLSHIKKKHPDLKAIIVPRHPERFDEVASLLHKNKIPFSRFSEPGPSKDIILMDAMGQLKKCYQLSTISLVAGSWNPNVGGHNILEPCFYGKPVIFGPHMHSQPDFVDLIHHYEAGKQVEKEKLAETIQDWLQNPLARETAGRQGKRLAEENRGALASSFDFITQHLNKRIAHEYK